MTRFVQLRILTGLASLLVVSLAIFLFPYVAEGDPVRAIIRARTGQLSMDDETVAALRIALGLDQPLLGQYLSWLGRALLGDFGVSYTTRVDVISQIAPALGTSLILILTALLAAASVSVPLAVFMAMNKGSKVDRALTTITQSFIAIPEYWLAPLLMLLFALYLGILPSAGWNGPSYVILPAFVLALRPLAYFTHVTRASMIDVLQSSYIVAARARGMTLRQAVLRHGVRNGIGPLVLLFGVWFGGLLAGAVIIEVIFAIPGMGRLIYSAVINRDMPLLQASILILVTLQIIVNTVSDFAQMYLNPAAGADRDR